MTLHVICHFQLVNAHLKGTLQSYEADKSKLVVAQMQQSQAVAERDKYMEKTLTLQKQLLDKQEVLAIVEMVTTLQFILCLTSGLPRKLR